MRRLRSRCCCNGTVRERTADVTPSPRPLTARTRRRCPSRLRHRDAAASGADGGASNAHGRFVPQARGRARRARCRSSGGRRQARTPGRRARGALPRIRRVDRLSFAALTASLTAMLPALVPRCHHHRLTGTGPWGWMALATLVGRRDTPGCLMGCQTMSWLLALAVGSTAWRRSRSLLRTSSRRRRRSASKRGGAARGPPARRRSSRPPWAQPSGPFSTPHRPAFDHADGHAE